MRTKMLLALTCVLLLVSTAAAGPGDTLWTRTYGGSYNEYGYSVQQTSDGGYVIAGGTGSFGAGWADVYLLKTDSSGDTLWTRTYGGSDSDNGRSVQQTSDGGYIVAGETYSFGAGESDVWLLKTDSSGDTLWTRTYGGSGYDGGHSVQQTSDGGYIITGYTGSFGAGYEDVYLLKADSSGDTLWTRTYGGSDYDRGYSVQQTSDGGYIIAGYTGSFGAGYEDVYLLKADSSADTLWTRTYGGSDWDGGYSVQQTSDGGYIIAAYTESFGAGSADVYLLKTDSSGDTLWTRTYGGSYWDEGNSVQQTFDGGYIITGYTGSFGAGSRDVYLLKTDSSGDTLWTRTYGGSDRDAAYSVQQTSDGGYIIAGYTDSFGAGQDDVYLIKAAGGGVMIDCENPSPWFCRGGRFLFKLTLLNNTGGNISGTLTFSGYSGYDCDPGNVLVSIPKAKSYPPGVTEELYFFKVPNAVGPGQYSASVGGTLGDVDLFCCMNTEIAQCGPWKTGGNSEWELVEVDRPDVALPTATELYQNYPNPFNATTQFSYSLAEAGNVKLTIHNLRGQLVETVVDTRQGAGEHQVIWDALDYSSGVYFYKLQAGDFISTKKMNLLK